MNKGYVSLYRKIQHHDIWQEKPFDKAHAWMDLLIMASHKKQVVEVNGADFELGRGELLISKVELSKRWGWSRPKVYRFFEYLIKEKMIENLVTPNVTPNRTVDVTPNRTPPVVVNVTYIKLVNYSKFQDRRTPQNTTRVTPNRTADVTPVRTENVTLLNNNNNNINNLSYKNTNNARAREERKDENNFSFSTDDAMSDEEYENSELMQMMRRAQESRSENAK